MSVDYHYYMIRDNLTGRINHRAKTEYDSLRQHEFEMNIRKYSRHVRAWKVTDSQQKNVVLVWDVLMVIETHPLRQVA